MSTIDKHQGMRACLNDVIDYINGKLQTRFADNPVRKDQLSRPLEQLVDFCETLPDIEFGYETVDTIAAGGSVDVAIAFANAKAEAPLLLTGVYQNGTSKLTSKVKYTTTAAASVTVYNLGTDSATNVTLDWLAISGR